MDFVGLRMHESRPFGHFVVEACVELDERAALYEAKDELESVGKRASRKNPTEKKCHMSWSSFGANTSFTLSSSTKAASRGKTYSTASEISTPGSQSGKKCATRALKGKGPGVRPCQQFGRDVRALPVFDSFTLGTDEDALERRKALLVDSQHAIVVRLAIVVWSESAVCTGLAKVEARVRSLLSRRIDLHIARLPWRGADTRNWGRQGVLLRRRLLQGGPVFARPIRYACQLELFEYRDALATFSATASPPRWRIALARAVVIGEKVLVVLVNLEVLPTRRSL